MIRFAIIYLLVCLALGGAAMVACAGANTSTNIASTNITTNNTTYIFIQEGYNGSFVKDQSGDYTLTINKVIPYTVYLSDRPARDAGLISMQNFIDGFDWSPNPPNAAILLRDGSPEEDMVVAVLTSPKYDGANCTLVYKAKLIKAWAFKSQWGQNLTVDADPAIPESFGHVMLAIDSADKISYRNQSQDPNQSSIIIFQKPES